jgi:MFS family permease
VPDPAPGDRQPLTGDHPDLTGDHPGRTVAVHAGPSRRSANGPGPPGAAPAPVRVTFLLLGAFWGTWAVAVFDVQRTFHLTDGALGTLLAVAVGSAAVGGAVVSHRAERWGTGPMLAGSLVAWALLLVGAAAAGPWPVFAVLFCAAEVAGGCVDTAMNAAASRRLAGRPGALVRFHALFNAGALCGAGMAGLVLWQGVSWRWLWPLIGLGALGLAAWVWRTALPEPESVAATPATVAGTAAGTVAASDGEADTPARSAPQDRGRAVHPVTRLRVDGLLLLLGVFALAEVVEGGVDTWGVLYLRTHLATGVLLGAGAYVVGQSVAVTTRGAGGPLLGRLSPRAALVVGGLLAGGGILLESRSPAAVAAACGLALGAGGASLFWPLVMSEVTRHASRATSAVGAFTAAGYVGWVAGAPAVGWVSDTWGPARGLQLLASLAGVVVVASLLRRGGRRPRSTGR